MIVHIPRKTQRQRRIEANARCLARIEAQRSAEAAAEAARQQAEEDAMTARWAVRIRQILNQETGR